MTECSEAIQWWWLIPAIAISFGVGLYWAEPRKSEYPDLEEEDL